MRTSFCRVLEGPSVTRIYVPETTGVRGALSRGGRILISQFCPGSMSPKQMATGAAPSSMPIGSFPLVSGFSSGRF